MDINLLKEALEKRYQAVLMSKDNSHTLALISDYISMLNTNILLENISARIFNEERSDYKRYQDSHNEAFKKIRQIYKQIRKVMVDNSIENRTALEQCQYIDRIFEQDDPKFIFKIPKKQTAKMQIFVIPDDKVKEFEEDQERNKYEEVPRIEKLRYELEELVNNLIDHNQFDLIKHIAGRRYGQRDMIGFIDFPEYSNYITQKKQWVRKNKNSIWSDYEALLDINIVLRKGDEYLVNLYEKPDVYSINSFRFLMEEIEGIQNESHLQKEFNKTFFIDKFIAKLGRLHLYVFEQLAFNLPTLKNKTNKEYPDIKSSPIAEYKEWTLYEDGNLYENKRLITKAAFKPSSISYTLTKIIMSLVKEPEDETKIQNLFDKGIKGATKYQIARINRNLIDKRKYSFSFSDNRNTTSITVYHSRKKI